jgi:hypothetical protein
VTGRKNWLLAIGIILGVVLLGLIVKNRFFSKAGLGALQVTTTPRATIFIDGTQAGITNFFNDKIKAGEHIVKLVPEATGEELADWEGKVVLSSGISTVINRSFGASEQTSSGEVLTLEKISGRGKSALAVISVPDQAMVKLDGEPQGFAPVLKEDLPSGAHQVVVSNPGYEERTIPFKAVAGYKLIINVQLSRKIEVGQEATASGEARMTPTPTTKGKAVVTPRPTTTLPDKPYVVVKETPTGWLRVRMGPSVSATEAAKIGPGEAFPYLSEEKSGWLKIEYEDNKEGWVSGVYVDLVK